MDYLIDTKALAKFAATAEPTREQKCAELARRMGYSVVQSGTYFYLIDPLGCKQENADGYAVGSTCEAGAWMDAPDPFTSAEGSRELVLWLAKQIESRGEIVQEKFESLLLHENVFNLNKELGLGLFYLTAPLPVIAEAACKALGICELNQ